VQLLVAHIDGVNFMPPPPPSINRYDNGSKGNYWISYNGSDKNGDGIGDTAYYLYQNNQDNFPLMTPVSVSGASMPTGQLPDNEAQPGQTQVPEVTAGSELPIGYVLIAIIVVVVASLLLYYKKGKRGLVAV
jgi:hypothetical protein